MAGFYSFGRVKIISRGGVKSAVATAAYHAGIEIKNEYDGLVHNHTRKKNVGDTYIRMPESAPATWRDESVPAKERLGIIWNDVEAASPAENARLARSNYLALPHVLTVEQGLECVDRWVERNCTSRGMGVTYSLHNKPNNRHVDMMYLVNEYDPNGKPVVKSKKEYLCRNKKGEERYFDSTAFKGASGWEKVYKYQKDGQRSDMTPSEASEAPGWERINKHPVCRTVKVGGWDEPDLAKKWRKSWEEVLNEMFEELGLDDRVDCRSYAERGLNVMPTVHEGWGPESSERREHNNHVRQYNHALDELRQDGVAAVAAIQAQIQQLRYIEQTEQTLLEHERRYRYHEATLQRIVDSGLFQGGLAQRFIDALHALSVQIKELFQRCWEYIRGGDDVDVDRADDAATSLMDVLNDAYRRAGTVEAGSSERDRGKDD